MGKTQTMLHKGKTIFYMDFTGLKAEEDIMLVVNESKAYIRSKPFKTIYTLANIEDMHFNPVIREIFVDFVKGNKEYVRASAVVGVNGLKQILFNGIMKLTGRDIRSINTIEEAKDWLVSFN